MQASRAALTVADVGSAKQRCGYRLAGAGFSIGVYTARWDFLFSLAKIAQFCVAPRKKNSTIDKIAVVLFSRLRLALHNFSTKKTLGCRKVGFCFLWRKLRNSVLPLEKRLDDRKDRLRLAFLGCALHNFFTRLVNQNGL